MTIPSETPSDAGKAPATAAKTPAQKPAKAKKARAKKRTLTAARKAELAARISHWPRGSLTDLADQLKLEEGLTFRHTSEDRTYAKIAGIEAGARGNEADALINWANAARRTAQRAR